MPTAQIVATPTQHPQHPKGEGYNALVGSQWVRTAPDPQQPIRFYTKDSLAQRSDDAGSVYENVLDIGYAFARADFSGGEGLDWSPRQLTTLEAETELDQVRYWDSENVNIGLPVSRGEPYTVGLSPLMEVWRNETGLRDLASSDDYIYVAFGNTVQWWENWEDLSPADTGVTTTDIAKIVASPVGDICAILLDGTAMLSTGGGSFVAITGLSDLAVNTWHAKGRFIIEQSDGSGSSTLVELSGTVAGDPFDTYRGVCHSLVSSGPAIVGAFSDGTLRSYVPEQANQQDPTSLNLVIRGRIEVPEGEVPYLLGSNAAVLLILTRASNQSVSNTIRLYQGEVLDARFDYTVGQLSNRREWNEAPESVDLRQNMASTRNEIYFMVQEDSSGDSVWRYDLITQGLSRHIRSDSVVSGIGLVFFDNRAGLIDGDDIFYTGDTYEDEGWLIMPNVNFGVNTDISWLSAAMRASNIVSGGKQIELYYSTDPAAITDEAHVSWKILSRISNPGQEDVSEDLVNVTSRSLALMIRLFSTQGGSQSPLVSRVALRGIPLHRDWVLELPVNVSDIIEVPGRMPIRIPNYGDTVHQQMLDLIGRSLTVDVLDPPFLFTGIIDNIVEPTEYVSDRGASSVRIVLQCRGSKRSVTVSSVGDAGLGLGTLGINTLGIGQTERT